MAIDFASLLTDEQKKAIIEQRLQQFAAEAYQHSLNKQLALKTDNEDAVEQADNAMSILDEAIKLHQEELKKFL